VEDVVRSNGAVPATIAILDGVVHVGLDQKQLEKLGTLGAKCRKCSRRDLGLVVSTKGNGATTVAATMYIASMVGIKVFVTGGIGGAHRGVERTLDISADLTELARTRVTVVCAGVKSILDIPKTLEILETAGVPVIGYKASEFPAFFSRKSGSKAPIRLDSTEEIARLIVANEELSMQNGVIVAVPVPEKEAGNHSAIETATKQALKEADERKIQGKDITPFLLDRINQITGGHSLQANVSLVLNNAKIGTKIAVKISQLKRCIITQHAISTLLGLHSN